MDLERLKEILKDEKPYRLRQAEKAVYRDLVDDWGAVSSLPASLRDRLTECCPISIDYRSIVSKSKDTVKALIRLTDGLAVETVLLQHAQDRNTVCVSSQVGCQLGCLFCKTGKIGYRRNLTAYEIAEQVLFFSYYFKEKDNSTGVTANKSAHKGPSVTNVVFMGMGEPFLNYDNVMDAVRILNDKDKFNIGARKISISTCGIPQKIEKLSKENLQVNLAISLSAPNNKLRSRLMPINEKYPVKAVINAAKKYIAGTNRRVMFEYVLIDKFNESPETARELAEILKGLLCFVNLIPYNGKGALNAPSKEKIALFKSILKKSGISVTERYRFGQDINAACGQLLYRRD
ncbi:MAG: 23S rRNA (adenine(2503)-C(2))-methyltransferase RlmN [Actinobacteria bacterium]|nr:23S rRNA (adenine(2503)-C(2))-methyltransferase RlmN [Actinomycetota bacterium]MCL5072050.1 23S rRNA (adenine(2503)-C(2))-methyltransferase RlmN [Actinomycetota bacterium]